jgi:predicted phage terminase large subunit-like protein
MNKKLLQLNTILKELERRKASCEYQYYVQYVHHGQWIPARHLLYICDKLQQVEQGTIKRLMIFLPPRHGKSMCVTETFPSFFIAKNPERKVIVSSYGSDLAEQFGRRNREKIWEYGKALFNAELSDEKSSVTEWDIKGHRGGMLSVGIGGGITGHGADLLIIDDPIRNKESADSEVQRQKVWDEWQNTLRTRLHPGAPVIVILTRWHEDDLAGRLLNPEYGTVEPWDIVSIPALAEDDTDLLSRTIGDPLWPEHGYDTAWAEETKVAVGSQTWAALYQQRPSPVEGAMIKRGWWKYYDTAPQLMTLIQSWDCTFKDNDTSDYVVGQVWGKVGADIYLLDQVRDRMDFPTTVQAVKNMTVKWPQAKAKIIEDKANGSAVIQVLRSQIGGLIPVNPEGGKVARASAVSPYIEAGNVYLPNAPWVQDFVEECASFPNGKHDDQVDAMTQALNRLIYYYAELPKPEPVYQFEFEKPKPDAFVGGRIDKSYIDY